MIARLAKERRSGKIKVVGISRLLNHRIPSLASVGHMTGADDFNRINTQHLNI